VAVSLLGIGVLLTTKDTAFPGWFAVLPVLGAVLIIFAGAQAWINHAILSNRILVWFGLISFPLYLWHWPLLVWQKLLYGDLATPRQRIVLVAIAVGLAWATYFFVETKVKKAGTKCTQILIILMIMFVIAALGITCSVINPRQGNKDLTKILNAQLDWHYPGSNFSKVFNRELRVFSSAGGEGETVYIGDSNMEQYASRVNSLMKVSSKNLNTAIFIGNQKECSLLRELIENNGNCEKSVLELKKIVSGKNVSTIVFAAAWLSYEKALAKEDGFDSFIKLAGPNKRIFIILNIPSGDELSPKNMFTGSRFGTLIPKKIEDLAFDTERFVSKYHVVHNRLINIAHNTGAIVVNPMDFLCHNKMCPVFDSDGNPLYKDSNHITASYAEKSASFIDETLKPTQ
jgi:hypothetical protein